MTHHLQCVIFLGWGWGIRTTFGRPGSQANEHSSFVTFPCEVPQALLTPIRSGLRSHISEPRKNRVQDPVITWLSARVWY